MEKLIDIGVNFTNSRFKADLSTVIDNAISSALDLMIVTGTDILNSGQAIDLCGQYPNYLRSTVGVHPHHAEDFLIRDVQKIELLSKNTGVVSLGECGLDYYRDFSSKKAQLKCFEAQLEFATECQLPIFLHQREAHNDFFTILKKYRHLLSNVIVHCFTGSSDELNDYLELDTYIGITGWVTDPNRGQHLHKLLNRIPTNRLLVETDSPYLTPFNIKPRPRRNEPKFLIQIVQEMAILMKKDYDVLARETTQAAQQCFNL